MNAIKGLKNRWLIKVSNELKGSRTKSLLYQIQSKKLVKVNIET